MSTVSSSKKSAPTRTSKPTTSAKRSAPTKKPSGSTQAKAPKAHDQVRLSKDAGSQPQQGQVPNFSSWAAPSAAAKSPDLNPLAGDTLERKSKGQSVKDLQNHLNQGAKNQLEVDGKFGPLTQKAVSKFQKQHNLTVDGKVGPETMAALNKGLKPPEATSATEASNKSDGPGKTEGIPQPADKVQAVASTGKSGKRVDSFTFRSKPQEPDKVRKQIRDNRAQGKTTMVGIDPNNESEKQQRLARMARQEGAKTHLYLEGRGGPTGESGWGKEEWERTRRAAANVHPPIKLTHQSDSSAGMQEWNRRGWQEHSIGQARQAKAEGHDSVEVDNINRLNGGDNTKRTMDFYRQYASEYAKGDMPTLMMKNQTVSELKSVRTALDNYERTRNLSPEELARQPESVRNNRLPREMFSDYHIFENDGGDLTAKHIELTKAMGIKLLQSKDTHSYGASGNY